VFSVEAEDVLVSGTVAARKTTEKGPRNLKSVHQNRERRFEEFI
jgi:hypothetical protein